MMKKLEKIELYLLQKGNCFYCFNPMNFIRGQSLTNFTVDHFYPKTNGNTLKNNAVLACPDCNSKKGHKEPTKAEIIRKRILYKKIEKRRLKIKALKTN